jgi:hypothetical protein
VYSLATDQDGGHGGLEPENAGGEVKEQVMNMISALQARLAAKHPMYDAEEWRDISTAIMALQVLVLRWWEK